MHEKCCRRDECWKGHHHSYPKDVETALIARPWVGRDYATSRLLGIGINLHKGGSFRQMIKEVEKARQEIRE